MKPLQPVKTERIAFRELDPTHANSRNIHVDAKRKKVNFKEEDKENFLWIDLE